MIRSGRPWRVADPGACIWPVNSGVVLPDVVKIDGAVCCRGLLQCRARLQLDKITLEILSTGKGVDDLSALLRREIAISNPDNVHQDARICESYLGAHVLGNT